MTHAIDEPTTSPAPGNATARWASLTFGVLFAMNLLNYMDRWLISGVLTRLQADLHIDDAQAGSLNFYFLISYIVVSPFTGWAGDRMRRTWLLAFGVGLWSLATVGVGLSRDFTELRIARACLGVGEATYAVLAPALLDGPVLAQDAIACHVGLLPGHAPGIRARGDPGRPDRGEHRELAAAVLHRGRAGAGRGRSPRSFCQSPSEGRARGSTPSGSRPTSGPARLAPIMPTLR